MATDTPHAPPMAEDRKRLAIFCDGSWNDLRMAHLTNVARLAKCVEPRGRDGRRQVVFYDNGVGVGSGITRWVDHWVSLLGGSMGAGLDDKIETAYRFLVLNYEPGDEIFVFGFSRGAYTARSLCGLIRKCGILRREHFDKVPCAMELYRSDLKADNDVLVKFRADWGCRHPETDEPLVTGDEEAAAKGVWADRAIVFKKAEPGQGPGIDHHASDATGSEFSWLPPDPPPLGIYRLMYLGLWDTVGSLGIPSALPRLSKWFNRRYRFHDLNATRLLFSIRHACALDEDRKVFDISPVLNIHELNRTWAAARGRQVDDPNDEATYVLPTNRPFRQVWFPGVHGSVGGGNPERRLYSAALVWIAVGALRMGLQMKWRGDSELEQALELREHGSEAELRVEKTPDADGNPIPLKPTKFDMLGAFAGYAARTGYLEGVAPPTLKEPLTLDEVNRVALKRVADRADYRPPTLARIKTEDGKDLVNPVIIPAPWAPARRFKWAVILGAIAVVALLIWWCCGG